jgi:hypothetical protein
MLCIFLAAHLSCKYDIIDFPRMHAMKQRLRVFGGGMRGFGVIGGVCRDEGFLFLSRNAK